jgi:hypothetical protein
MVISDDKTQSVYTQLTSRIDKVKVYAAGAIDYIQRTKLHFCQTSSRWNQRAKVEVQIDRVSPNWEKYEQEERGKPIRGGYRWRVQVPAGEQTTLSVQYTVKTFVDSELIGGNRRE